MTLTTGAFLRGRPQPEREAMSKIRILRPTVVGDAGGPAQPRDIGDVVEADLETCVFLIAHGKAAYVQDVEQAEDKNIDTKRSPVRRKG